MATKKNSTPVLEIPEEELDRELDKEAEALSVAAMRAEMEQQQKELARLQKENERLKQNSVTAYNAEGAKSDYERVQEACKKAAEEGKDAWSITISIRAPRKPAKEDPFYWLSVNGNTLQVPANDKYFDMKLPFAACLVEAIAADWYASDFADSIESYDPVTNPHRE